MYLKEESYYADLYDLLTVQDCLRAIEFWEKRSNDKKDMPDADKAKVIDLGLNLELYHIKGERYRSRSSSIREWMEKDRKREESVEKAQEPQNIRCPNCFEKMNLMLKDLYEFSGESSRVLFFFECPSCKKRKGIFEDGQVYASKPGYCPKCKKEVNASHKKEGNVITTIRNCPACGFSDTEVDDYDKSQAEREERQRQDQALLKKHRTEFCLSPKEGEEYFESVRRLETLRELLLKAKQKQTDPDYQKVAKLKKFKIIDLEQFLSEILGKEKYVKLSFEKPNIDKHIIVPFSAQDADSSQEERNSVYKLQRLIKKALEGTNWRLMSEGISCRLGYLSGRLKGYEDEDDLLKMVKLDGTTTDKNS